MFSVIGYYHTGNLSQTMETIANLLIDGSTDYIQTKGHVALFPEKYQRKMKSYNESCYSGRNNCLKFYFVGV